jgi:RNA polymerase sigma factor (sigma-70 family)
MEPDRAAAAIWGVPPRSHDGALIARSCSDPSAFGPIFDRHFDVIYMYLARRVGGQAAADLASDTFAEAFAVRARFDKARHDARPWLFGIATNMLRHHVRAARQRTSAPSRAEATALPVEEGVAARLDALRLRPVLLRALAELDEGQRDVLLLYAWAELDYGQIGDALELPIGTVRSRLSRARARLRELLAGSWQYEGEDGGERTQSGSAHG